MNLFEFETYFANQPTFPIYYSHQSGNLFYYVASCCVAPFHWGYVVTTQLLQPAQLGCNITTINELSLWAPLAERYVGEIESLTAVSQIGNGEFITGTPSLPVANTGVRVANRVMPVKFLSPDAGINDFLQGKKFILSIVSTKFIHAGEEVTTHALFADRCRRTAGGGDFVSTFNVEDATWSEEHTLSAGGKINRGRLLCLKLKETIDGKNTVWVLNPV